MSTNEKAKARSITTGEEWAVRHLYEEEWIESYWKSRDHPHRVFLAERISKFSPKSVLEIGCASGPNLYRLGKRFPNAELRGIDINLMAVKRGNEWLRKEGISNVKLEVGKAQELGRFADKRFDVVFTDAVLIYLPPDEIRQVAQEMLRIGSVLVLNEWHLFGKSSTLFMSMLSCVLKLKNEKKVPKQPLSAPVYMLGPQSRPLGLFAGHWIRDYMSLFSEFVPKEKISVTKLPKEVWDDKGWQRWGAIIEVVS